VIHISHVPILAVLGIPILVAAFSALVRFLVLEKGDDRPGIWNIFAIGPDLMVAAVVAVPALLAGGNAARADLASSQALRTASQGMHAALVSARGVRTTRISYRALHTESHALHDASRALHTVLTINANWSPNGYLILMIVFLFGFGVAFERLWAKEARECDGWKTPFFKGVVPPAVCGFAAIGAALALGTS